MQDLTNAIKSVASTMQGVININPIIYEACDNSSNPTPGYLFKQIADMTFESTDTCMKILDLLTGFMSSKSPIVRYKALNVSKNCLQKGSPTFHRELAKRHHVIRDCLEYRGSADPLHGDALNSQVREMAQQVINMIYDTQSTTENQFSHVYPPQIPQQSISSDQISSKPSSNYYSSSQPYTPSNTPSTNNYTVNTTYAYGSTAEGGKRVYKNTPKAIGSYIEYQPSTLETMFEKVGETIESLKNTISSGMNGTDDTTRAPEAQIYGANSNSFSRPFAGTQSRPISNAPSLSYSSKYTIAPESSLDSHGAEEESLSKHYSGWADPNSIGPSASVTKSLHEHNDSFSRPVSIISDSWEYKLIVSLTPATGRSSPPRNEISELVNKATQLSSNQEGIRNLLDAILLRIIISESWQSKLKTLYFLEAILKSQVPTSVEYTQQRLDILVDQYQKSVQSSLKEKVESIFLLYPESVRPKVDFTQAPNSAANHDVQISQPQQQEQQVHQQQQHHQQQGQQQLLDLLGLEPNNQEDRLFDGLITDSQLNVGNGSDHVPVVNHSNISLIDGHDHLQVDSTPSSSLFDGLDTDSSSNHQSHSFNSSSAKPGSTSSPSLLVDFFGQDNSSSTSNSSLLLPVAQDQNKSIESDLLSLSPSFGSRQSAIDSSFASLGITSNSHNQSGTLGQLQPNPTATLVRQAAPPPAEAAYQYQYVQQQLLALHNQIEIVQSTQSGNTQLLDQLRYQYQQLSQHLASLHQTVTSPPPLTSQTNGVKFETLYRQQNNQLLSPNASPLVSQKSPLANDLEQIQKSHAPDPFGFVRDAFSK